MSDKIDDIVGYNSLDFVTNEVVEGFITGLHKSPLHGFSVEFAEHRLYNTGESIRNIDWKLYGRSDKLFVKKFEEETNLRCVIVLDKSSSMFFPTNKGLSFSNPNKMAFSIYASAVIINMLYRQQDAFGLAFLSDRIELLTDIKSNITHKKYLFGLLQSLLTPFNKEKTNQTNLPILLHQLAGQIHKRSLVIIFTDLISKNSSEELIDALQHLKYSKHEVILFHVEDKEKEKELNFSNRPHRFIDTETKEEIKINPQEIKDEYKKRYLSEINKIKTFQNNASFDFVEVDINRNFDQILLPYLIKRTKMY
ncbi:MAG: DUF58 domain-containing protein [Bacteroidales bacterium]|jgi:uncharacterized protein (DUF58 family)|nr:DUF58 domain-containing protein [Bacteroidales bacterium]